MRVPAIIPTVSGRVPPMPTEERCACGDFADHVPSIYWDAPVCYGCAEARGDGRAFAAWLDARADRLDRLDP